MRSLLASALLLVVASAQLAAGADSNPPPTPACAPFRARRPRSSTTP